MTLLGLRDVAILLPFGVEPLYQVIPDYHIPGDFPIHKTVVGQWHPSQHHLLLTKYCQLRGYTHSYASLRYSLTHQLFEQFVGHSDASISVSLVDGMECGRKAFQLNRQALELVEHPEVETTQCFVRAPAGTDMRQRCVVVPHVPQMPIPQPLPLPGDPCTQAPPATLTP